jgi:hypothetical protein
MWLWTLWIQATGVKLSMLLLANQESEQNAPTILPSLSLDSSIDLKQILQTSYK